MPKAVSCGFVKLKHRLAVNRVRRVGGEISRKILFGVSTIARSILPTPDGITGSSNFVQAIGIKMHILWVSISHNLIPSLTPDGPSKAYAFEWVPKPTTASRRSTPNRRKEDFFRHICL